MGTSHRLIAVRHRRTTAPVFGRLAYWRALQRTQGTNLQAYWPLSEPSGTTVYDKSGRTTARNASIVGTGMEYGETGPESGGKCMELKGATAINIYSAELASGFNSDLGTAAAWFKCAAPAWTDGANRQILQLRADSSNLVRFYKSTAANTMILEIKAGTGTKTFTLLIGSTLWTHVAMSWDKANNQVKAYVNGKMVGSILTYPGDWTGTLTNGNMYVGSINSTPTNPWIGWLAHVQIWSKALTALEIMRLVKPYNRLYPDRYAAENAGAPLVTPTSDALGTACHPSVIYSASGWNSYKYWMAMSPYPGDARENPEILASNDGNTWSVPVGLTNPIDPAPAAGSYNSDPDLILGQDNSLYCFYREYVAADNTSAIKVRSSADGVTWSAESTAIASNSGAWSPSVVWDGAQYVIFYVAANQTPRRIERRTAAAPGGPWAAAVICPMNYPGGFPTGKEPWHISVYKDTARWVAVMVMVDQGASDYTGARLHLAFSEDGFVWVVNESPLLMPGAEGSWTENRVYRGSCLPNAAGGYDLWYSALDGESNWRIGRTVITGV